MQNPYGKVQSFVASHCENYGPGADRQTYRQTTMHNAASHKKGRINRSWLVQETQDNNQCDISVEADPNDTIIINAGEWYAPQGAQKLTSTMFFFAATISNKNLRPKFQQPTGDKKYL